MHSVHFYSSLSLKLMGFVSWLMQQRTCVFICTVLFFFSPSRVCSLCYTPLFTHALSNFTLHTLSVIGWK